VFSEHRCCIFFAVDFRQTAQIIRCEYESEPHTIMSTEATLIRRSENKCELCNNISNLSVYEVPPSSDGSAEQCILICDICLPQIDVHDNLDINHWRCLNDTMWSEVAAVQVVAFRMLTVLNDHSWARALLENLYLEDDTQKWAQLISPSTSEDHVIHKDSNGAVLSSGDTVSLIKDLNVKGGGFTAKRGEMVRNISLVADNADHIEGKVSGQHIVILTKFVKKMN